MTTATSGPDTPPAAHTTSKLRFIAWRWHFYAGLYVIPFLCISALTGLVMLWTSWTIGLDSERTRITPGSESLAVSALQEIAEQTVAGTAVQYLEPLAPDRVAVFSVATDMGRTGVALDPFTGGVVSQFEWRDGIYEFANLVHSTLLLGDIGDRAIELAASLAVLLITSGLYLHWPRSGGGFRAMILPRLSTNGRAFWKSLHGAIGTWVSLFLLVFLVSGLSWAGIWGDRIVQGWNTFPAEKWGVPLSDATHADMNHTTPEVPWALEQTPLPLSGSLAGERAIPGSVDIDSVAAFARSLGLNGRFQINLPQDPTGVWTISHDSMSNDGPDPTADRTIHIDRHSGNVLADVRFADYSPYAKGMAVGIAFHEGDLGVWNLVLNTVICLSVIALSVSGAVMWWKRRPSGATRLAAPPRPQDTGFWAGGAVLVVMLGLLFPLAGMAIIAVLIADQTVLRVFPALKQRLS